MTPQQIFDQFNSIDDEYRMLVIDAVAVGCYLVQHGQQTAGIKLIHTAVKSAGLGELLVKTLLSEGVDVFDSMAMHAEIRDLVKNFSG